ncbi:MAG TPA: DNA-3-methyladenine glycosylase 2 family protein [Candidatus Limnocylindria bacterium]
MIERRIALRGPLDLVRTLSPLAHGRGDRTIRLAPSEAWLARRLASGPATLQVRLATGAASVTVRAWGDGAEEALETAPALIGELDEPERLIAHHPVVRRLQRTHPGLRLPRSGQVLHALVPSILEQKITGTEAFRAYAALLRAHGEPAPGPGGLVLPPSAATLAGLPSYAFHPLGVERRRAEVIRRVASRAAWLEAAPGPAEATTRLLAFRGIGPWTVAEVVRAAYGDPDAVSVGDYHIPNTVAWVLAGEPRGDDARMLELLEPYRGQRGRVQRLLEVGRLTAPRYGPRMAPRHIAAI